MPGEATSPIQDVDRPFLVPLHSFSNCKLIRGRAEAAQETKAMAKERLRQAVEDAAKEASSKGSWGSVSSEMRKKIMDMITSK